MADSKVTDFTAATSVNPADVLYVIQGSNDRKISMSTLLANLPDSLTKFSGLVALAMNNAQTLVGSGAIQTTQTLTLISNTGATSYLTLNNGAFDGQIKIVLCTSATSNSTITNNIKATNITFSKAGDTVLLVWFNAEWWVLGGTAVVVV
jgi:hypothetical protein